jgi:hypothetical protein
MGPWVPASVSAMTITATESSKLSASGKAVIVSTITAALNAATGCAFPGHTFVGGAGLITATATKVSSLGMAPMREGDEGLCVGGFTNNSSGASVPCACKFKITAAGQDKVEAE